MRATASGPCSRAMPPSLEATRSRASSQPASRKPPFSPDQGRAQAVLGVGELVGEAALHAGVAEVGRSRLRGGDVDHLAVLGVHVQGAADAAVGAGGGRRLVGQAEAAGAGLFEGGHGTLEDALAAADAVGLLEAGVVAGDHLGVVAAARHLQDEGALHLVAGAHAAGAADALVHLELDEGVGVVRLRVVSAGALVARRAQADLLGQALQLAAAVGRAVEALQGVVGDDELGDVAAQAGDQLRGGPVAAAVGDRCVAGGHGLAALVFDEAGSAGAVGLHAVGVAQGGGPTCPAPGSPQEPCCPRRRAASCPSMVDGELRRPRLYRFGPLREDRLPDLDGAPCLLLQHGVLNGTTRNCRHGLSASGVRPPARGGSGRAPRGSAPTRDSIGAGCEPPHGAQAAVLSWSSQRSPSSSSR